MSSSKVSRSRSRKQRDDSPGKPDFVESSPVAGAAAMNGHEVMKLKYRLEDLDIKKTIGMYAYVQAAGTAQSFCVTEVEGLDKYTIVNVQTNNFGT